MEIKSDINESASSVVVQKEDVKLTYKMKDTNKKVYVFCY